MKAKKNKVKVKKSVRNFGIFMGVITILGLIFMNFMFTLVLDLGIMLIIWLSKCFDKSKKKKWVRILINCVAVFILLCAIGGVGVTAWFLDYVVKHAPEFNEDALTMTQTTIVYDSNGVEYAELGNEKREIIKYNQISDVLVDALIATEDSRFFQHNGFDAPRFLIASIKQALGNKNAGGASTLTMQVAKNSYNKESANVTKGFKGIVRKFTDIYMAVYKIEKNYSKEEIIEFYVNNHFLGNNAYGVEQASQTYFGKHASEINLSEAALLVGLFQAPTSNNPFKYPDKATERRAEVLNLMYRHGYITEEEKNAANAIPVSSLLTASKTEQEFYSYLNTVVEEAIETYGVNPHTTSLLVYTNMNREYQKVIDDVLSGKTYTWDNPVVQAGVIVTDIHSGKILAVGAGRNQDGYNTHNYATSSTRQIGSTAKPIFDYGPGMEYNNWSTYKLFDDSKYYYTSGQEIRNSDRSYMGVITLRKALAESRNIPALKAFQQVDNKKIYEFATSLGITLDKEAKKTGKLYEAYSLGSFNATNPLEMAGAYAAFGNGGYYYKPYTISKIVFRDTGESVEYESEKKQVMSDSTAFMMTDVLKSAVNEGLSSVAKINGVNIAAKTGTTNYDASTIYNFGLPNSAINDAWVVGYDPHVCISLWYGYEPISREYWTTALTAWKNRKGLWNAIGGKIFQKDGSDFQMPNSVVKVGVELSSDVDSEPKLPSEYTPADKIVYEYFKKGTEPTEVSTAYQPLPNPSSLSASYNASTLTVNLSWDAATVTDPMTSYGDLGYRVYKDGTLLGFTKDTTFEVLDTRNPNGTYKVVTSYRDNESINSPGITYKLVYDDPNDYKLELLVPKEKTYKVGDKLESYDTNVGIGDVKLTVNGKTVTPTVNVKIENKDNDNIANITTTEENTFTITYAVSYEAYIKTITRTIKIIKNEKDA